VGDEVNAMKNRSLVIVLLSLVACGGAQPKQAESVPEGDPASAGASATDAGSASEPAEEVKTPVPTAPAPQGHYDKDATEMVLKRSARQVKENCGAAKDETGKATGPWGKVTIQIALGRNGHSKEVTVPAPFEGKASGKCIVQAFTNLQYPPWAGSDESVDWEVEVVKPAGVK